MIAHLNFYINLNWVKRGFKIEKRFQMDLKEYLKGSEIKISTFFFSKLAKLCVLNKTSISTTEQESFEETFLPQVFALINFFSNCAKPRVPDVNFLQTKTF